MWTVHKMKIGKYKVLQYFNNRILIRASITSSGRLTCAQSHINNFRGGKKKEKNKKAQHWNVDEHLLLLNCSSSGQWPIKGKCWFTGCKNSPTQRCFSIRENKDVVDCLTLIFFTSESILDFLLPFLGIFAHIEFLLVEDGGGNLMWCVF